ncbi:MAG: hypothetical protein Q9160_002784 [Pyrenula sp. 1 TL-2023]
MTSLFGGSSSSPGSSSSTPSLTNSNESKTRIISQIQQETNMANAKQLIQKINENCFATCIPSPGASLSSKESTCLSTCMEKYIDSWNTVSKTYIQRIQKDAPGLAATGAADGAGLLSSGGASGGGGGGLF